MLHDLHKELAPRDIALRVVGAHGRVRDLLRADGLGDKVGGLDRMMTLAGLIGAAASAGGALQADGRDVPPVEGGPEAGRSVS